jgi:Nif-specific regulatory protein
MSDIDAIGFDKLKTLIEINTRINSSYSDVNTLLVYILDSAMRLVECESSSLLLVNKGDNTLRFMVALGPKGAEAKDIVVDKKSIAGWVVSHNQYLILNDVQHDPRFFTTVQEKTGYVSNTMIAIPMHVKEKCMGVIELINKANGRQFDQSDLDILELLANQAAIAYQNADTYRSAQDRISVLQDAVKSGSEYHTFIAKSPLIIDLVHVIEEVAKTNSSVLIMGESGVGKELFAEQLHLKSMRNGKPFVRVNCAALSPALLESELFGHVKGAYTDAVSNQKGRFEMADGGTIFLDEIGELPLDLQSKLLRVIQSRQFERVGSSETISVDVRIIAATNRDLEAMVKEGTFRSDLYYRLNVLPLNVPPLRQRKEDIEPLARFFLKKFSDETKKNFEGFSQTAVDALYSYYWPGNIRELENSIERACVLGHPPLIQVGDLRIPNSESNSVQNSGDENIQGAALESASGEDRSLKTALTSFKKAYVTKILQQTNGNQTETAKILGVQRTYVSRLLNELDIRDKN